MPLISIIIPTYNRAHVLPNVIKSVLDQTFKDWELIVVDDGSDDGTEEVVLSFLADIRIFYKYQKNNGVSAARNLGASFATGEYLVFLDSDDLVKEYWLFDFWSIVSKKIKCQVVFCGAEVRKLHLGTTKVEVPSKRLNKIGIGWALPISGSFLIRRLFFLELKGYDEKLKFSENTDLLIRIQSLNLDVAYIDNVNLVYLQSENGGNSNLSNKIDSIEYLLNKHTGFFDRFKKDKLNLLQTLAVSYLKLQKYSDSRKWFLSSVSIDPFNFKIYLRFILSYFSFAVKIIYG